MDNNVFLVLGEDSPDGKKPNIPKKPCERAVRRDQTVALLQASTICPFRWINSKFVCFYCSEKFSDPDDLREHTSAHKLTTKEVTQALIKLKTRDPVKVDISFIGCKLCDEQIPDFIYLKTHLYDKHGTKVNLDTNDECLPFKIYVNEYECTFCTQKYTTFKPLNEHINMHFNNYVCKECGAGFITPDRLYSHKAIHEDAKLKCERCPKVFRHVKALKKHVRDVHNKAEINRCPYCPETFKKYRDKKAHLINVHGFAFDEFKCDLCPKIFTLKGKLEVHLKQVHFQIKNHTCDECKSSFYQKTDLRDHMLIHTGERKYQCDICKKCFPQKKYIRFHLRVHERKDVFCKFCDMKFDYPFRLKFHIKMKHAKAKRKGLSA